MYALTVYTDVAEKGLFMMCLLKKTEHVENAECEETQVARIDVSDLLTWASREERDSDLSVMERHTVHAEKS